MPSLFEYKDKKITLINHGEHYGLHEGFSYNIGDKLFEFAKFDYKDFEKLRTLYSELIEIVIKNKVNNYGGESIIDIFCVIQKCLEFSPYTHFYNQLLVDTIIKTLNDGILRQDLVIKNRIKTEYNVKFSRKDKMYFDIFIGKEEEKQNVALLANLIMTKISNRYNKDKQTFLQFFEDTKNALISDFIKKSSETSAKISIMGKYVNEKAIRDLSPEQRMYLYELKGVFSLNCFTFIPTNAICLDATFKTKYITEKKLKNEMANLSAVDLAKAIVDNDIVVKQVYELDRVNEQINLELFKMIENNFIIKKCENCNKLFIPDKTDQIYCNNLYEDTQKTCKEIGAINKRKEKVEDSKILKEYNREYKRMYGLHYNHSKEFKEKKFKEWSNKARELKNNYTDNQLEDFKYELKNLSNLYWDKN